MRAKTIDQLVNENWYPLTAVKVRKFGPIAGTDYVIDAGEVVYITGYDKQEARYTAVHKTTEIDLYDSKSWALVKDPPDFDWSLDIFEWLPVGVLAVTLSIGIVRAVADICHEAKHPVAEVQND